MNEGLRLPVSSGPRGPERTTGAHDRLPARPGLPPEPGWRPLRARGITPAPPSAARTISSGLMSARESAFGRCRRLERPGRRAKVLRSLSSEGLETITWDCNRES